jgi:hypothetical protein
MNFFFKPWTRFQICLNYSEIKNLYDKMVSKMNVSFYLFKKNPVTATRLLQWHGHHQGPRRVEACLWWRWPPSALHSLACPSYGEWVSRWVSFAPMLASLTTPVSRHAAAWSSCWPAWGCALCKHLIHNMLDKNVLLIDKRGERRRHVSLPCHETCLGVWVWGIRRPNLLEIFSILANSLYMP